MDRQIQTDKDKQTYIKRNLKRQQTIREIETERNRQRQKRDRSREQNTDRQTNRTN